VPTTEPGTPTSSHSDCASEQRGATDRAGTDLDARSSHSVGLEMAVIERRTLIGTYDRLPTVGDGEGGGSGGSQVSAVNRCTVHTWWRLTAENLVAGRHGERSRPRLRGRQWRGDQAGRRVRAFPARWRRDVVHHGCSVRSDYSDQSRVGLTR
jgi:hypothetical protein